MFCCCYCMFYTLCIGKLRYPTFHSTSRCALIDVITCWVGNFPLWSGNVYTVLNGVIFVIMNDEGNSGMCTNEQCVFIVPWCHGKPNRIRNLWLSPCIMLIIFISEPVFSLYGKYQHTTVIYWQVIIPPGRIPVTALRQSLPPHLS